MDKKAWLDKLYYLYGRQTTDFRLCYTYIKNEEPYFSKWVKYLDAQSDDTFISKVNQRTLLNTEVVIDIDDGHNYIKVINKLKKDGYKFFAFSTKSRRAWHIHLYFRELAILNKRNREELREKIILKYGGDTQLKIDNHMIPIEFCKHWKTGEVKNLIFKNE